MGARGLEYILEFFCPAMTDVFSLVSRLARSMLIYETHAPMLVQKIFSKAFDWRISQMHVACRRAIAAEVAEFGSGGTAFLSTPSIYFSLDKDHRANCKVFDLDTKWAKDPGFVHYDFSKPEDIPEHLRGTFEMVVADPPFITRQVWESYTAATKLLLRPGGAGLVLCSTISENAPFMQDLLGANPCKFKPSIPNLVYQYSLYVNYNSKRFSVENPEIPSEE